MSNETDLDELSILRRGYERFAGSPGDLDNAIITVHRQQQITTHFGPLTTKNKIKVSLSQEQILNQANRFRPNVTRSQSINIQKSVISPSGLIKNEFPLNRNFPARPSMIPVKIKDQSKLRALTLGPNHDQTVKYRTVRKLSAPFERRSYVSNEESTLSSLPISMSQSSDAALLLGKNRDSSDDLMDKFKCGICMNVLNDSRVLNCLHTFCLECLYSIENVGQSKTTKSKLNSMVRQTNSIDTSSASCSESTKENGKKVSKSSIALLSSAKPIKATPKKSTDDQKKPLTMQSRRPLSAITEKSKVSLKCPMCGLRTDIAIGGVSRVPKNYLLERQLRDTLEQLQTNHVPSQQYCSQCYEKNESIAFCVDCEINLCNICHEAHLRQRWTSKHNVIASNDNKFQIHSDNKKDKNAPLKCFVHPKQDVTLFCVNCDQVACHNCTILLHKGHKFETIDGAKDQIIKSFITSVEKNRKLHEYVDESVSQLTGSIAKINASAELVQNEIEMFLKDYFEALEAHKTALLRQICKMKEMKSLSILEQQEYLTKRSNELNQANQFAENLLENGNEIEILTFIGVLQNRFEWCKKWEMPLDPKVSHSFGFIRDIRAPITPQQHNIPIYGVLVSEESDAK